MTRFASSSAASDRSLLRPASTWRLLGGWAAAVAGPIVAALLSVHVLHLVPGLAFLVVVVLAAVAGRTATGLFAAALSTILLTTYGPSSPETSIFDGAGLASVVAFVALATLTAIGLPRLELAADS